MAQFDLYENPGRRDYPLRQYVLVFQELAAIPVAVLNKPVGSLADRRYELIAAIDLLFTGI